MVCPYNHKFDGLMEAKHQCMLKNNVTILTDCSIYFDYIIVTYGKDFLNNFRKN